MHTRWLYILIIILLLGGCTPGEVTVQQATPTPTTPTPSCTSPGTTQVLYERTIGNLAVYLPPCFDPQVLIPYPVLYLLPGRGGSARSWDLLALSSQADPLIQAGEVRPLLIVMTDEAFDYLSQETITEELIPYIEKNYPASGERRFRAIGGFSLGGYCAYLLAFQRPNLFSSAGVFGNGLVSGQEQQVRDLLAAIPVELKPRLFLNSGEQDTYMLQQAWLLLPLLDEAGIEHKQVFAPGGHDSATWLGNFPTYLRWLEEGWR